MYEGPCTALRMMRLKHSASTQAVHPAAVSASIIVRGAVRVSDVHLCFVNAALHALGLRSILLQGLVMKAAQ
ncbi:hypothetical protein [Pseudomonas cedrina]|uniref:hypothetical protein n=1 Tax=Pseudomonas cedrina TaxID=651740 RepID=UPI00277F29A2|nr:hypothetical protein [Pseudomonas cedrina]MDQ0652532.1 hypothetical protein [Pseudomonas cedrina]